MPRIPYPDTEAPEVKPLADRIVQERGGLLRIFRMLMHSPELTEGWLAYFNVIRFKSTLPGYLRELAIMRVAAVNGASYEAFHHAPVARGEGVSQEQLDAIANDWVGSDQFDARERAILAYTDSVSREVQVPEAVLNAAREAVADNRQLVELTATIAAYNMVSRILEALGIDEAEAIADRA
jgi:uncharacterized peroxidase-related enzyme